MEAKKIPSSNNAKRELFYAYSQPFLFMIRLQCTRNLFVLDFVSRFFVSCDQISEVYAVRTLMKFGCNWQKIGHKSKCRKDPESTFYKYISMSPGLCRRYVWIIPYLFSVWGTILLFSFFSDKKEQGYLLFFRYVSSFIIRNGSIHSRLQLLFNR